MARHQSALKKTRHDRARRVRNRSHAARLRTELKKFRALLAKGDPAASTGLSSMESLLDHSASVGVIHRHAAARTKSRLARHTAALPRA